MSDEQSANDEISLLDLFAVLWKRRVMIIVITLLAAVGAVVFSAVSLVLPAEESFYPNVYTTHALMLINNKSGGNSGGISSLLGASGMGGLAGLAGISVPAAATSSGLAVYLTGTNTFLDAVIDAFDLMAKFDLKKSKSPRSDSREILKKVLAAEYDEESGVFSINFTDADPVLAQRVVNYAVDFLARRFNELGVDQNKLEKENLEININSTYDDIMALEQERQNLGQMIQRGSTASIRSIPIETARIELELNAKQQIYTQLKVQYELLKVTMASESPVFQILEQAEVPDKKSGPSRGMLCVIVTAAAGFLSVFIAFVMNAVGNIRKDPAAMAKLRGEVL
jgi:uncharacterized protein involved in exopolysaccharide biosynthesis